MRSTVACALLMLFHAGRALAQSEPEGASAPTPAPAAEPVAPEATPPASPTPAAPRLVLPPSAAAQPEVTPVPAPAPEVQAAAPAAQPLPPSPQVPQPAPVARYDSPPDMDLPPPRLHPIEVRRHGDAGAPFTFAIGPTFSWRSDRGYRYLAEHDRSTDLELFGTYDVLAPVSRLVIAVGASYRHGSSSGNQGLDFAQHTVQAEIVPRVVVLPWLVPYARLAGGVITSVLELDTGYSRAFEGRDTGYVFTLGGGLTLRTPARLFENSRGHMASLGFGVAADAGYTFAPAAQFREKSEDVYGITRAPLSLGSLERKAPYVRLMVVVRF